MICAEAATDVCLSVCLLSHIKDYSVILVGHILSRVLLPNFLFMSSDYLTIEIFKNDRKYPLAFKLHHQSLEYLIFLKDFYYPNY